MIRSQFLLAALAVCFGRGLTDNSVRVIEDPVLIEFNLTHTAIRCSVEVGLLSPRIDLFIDNASTLVPFLRCNGELGFLWTAKDGHVASSCQKEGTSGVRVLHQTFLLRTCFEDSSQPQANNTVLHCKPASSAVTTSLESSRRARLIYNDRRQPRLVPLNDAAPLRVLSEPVCPGEPLGSLDLQSSVEQTSVVVVPSPSSSTGVIRSTSPSSAAAETVAPLPTELPTAVIASSSAPANTAHTIFASGPVATPLDRSTTPSPGSPTSTISPSASPTPVPPSEDEGMFLTLTEAELRLIIFIAAGVAALFAIIVVCLLCTLGCVLMRRRKTSNFKRAKKSVREALTEEGSKDDTIRLERMDITTAAMMNGHTSSSAREPQQFAIHRAGGSDSSSNTNSIRSETLERDSPVESPYDQPRDDVTDQGSSYPHNTTVAAGNLVRSETSPPVAGPKEETMQGDADDVANHDYDYIDDSQLPPRSYQKNSKLSSFSSDSSKQELLARNAKESISSEYSVPRLSCFMESSESVPQFPVTASLRMESRVEVTQNAQPSSPTSRHSLAASDYQNTPTASTTNPYQNGSMLTTSGTQTIRQGGISDSYQELNSVSDSDYTIGDSSSSSYFNHLDGFVRSNATGAEAPSHPEAKAKGLNKGVVKGLNGRTSSCSKNTNAEPLYHTVMPSSTGSSDSSTDSTGTYCLPPDMQARIKAGGQAVQHTTPEYATTSLHHQQQSSNQAANVPQGSKPAEHDYEDLDVDKLDDSQDYSTLSNKPTTTTTAMTSISTQTYA